MNVQLEDCGETEKPIQFSIFNNKRKRPYGEISDKPDVLLNITDDTVAPASKYREVDFPNNNFILIDFCDEILYDIFKYLDTYDLIAIRQTCSRFAKLSLDKRFWCHISMLDGDRNTYTQILQTLKLMSSFTTTLKIKEPMVSESGNRHTIEMMNKGLSKAISNAVVLTILELYAVQLDFTLFSYQCFPQTMKRLVIYNCTVAAFVDQHSSWLSGSHTHLCNLEDLCIEYNSWFDPYDIMPISKLPALRILSLRGCINFHNIVVYASIAAIHGFPKLQSLDMRHIPLTDSDLQCFNVVESLREIKLECPPFLSDIDAMQNNAYTLTTNTPTNASCDNFFLQTRTDLPSTSRFAMTSFNSVDRSLSTSSFPQINGHGRTYWNIDIENSSNRRQCTPDHLIYVDLHNRQNTHISTSNHNFLQDDERQMQDVLSDHKMSNEQVEDRELVDETQHGPNIEEQNQKQKNKSEKEELIKVQITEKNNVQRHENYSELNKKDNETNSEKIYEKVYPHGGKLVENKEQKEHEKNIEKQGHEKECHHETNQTKDDSRKPKAIISQSEENGNIKLVSSGYEQMQRIECRGLFRQISGGFVERGSLGRSLQNDTNCHLLDFLGYEHNNNLEHELRDRGCLRHYCLPMESHNKEFAYPRNFISDQGLSAFGRSLNPIHHGHIWITIRNRPQDTLIERMTVRNYRHVTDAFIRHIVQCSPHLTYLDVTGTSITRNALIRFKAIKPNCTIIAEHIPDL